jgi:hypothetical protein
MGNIDDKTQADASAKDVSINLVNWYQYKVLKKSTRNIASANETPTHLGNWYERNVLHRSTRKRTG